MSNVLILVPARYGSSRFPGKPLAKINSKPMIQYVVENCQESGYDYAIVTDNDEIEKFVNEIGGNIVRVDDDVSTGSARIALAFERYYEQNKYDYIVNVQGDEPLLDAKTICSIVGEHMKTDYDIFTGVKRRNSKEEDFKNPNIVKCIFSNSSKQCLYFSRASVPFARDDTSYDWYQHIGIYCYRPKALERFVNLAPGVFEELEKLEQLRALENNLTIGALELDINLIGVDTPEDIHKIEGALSE